tara:strand:- start:781 stop:1428 length:648 start_codon:yes stop_codon:yes gene_type:complete
MRFNAFYKIIDQITEMDLPGEKVQLLMAPPFREYLMEKFKRSTIKAMPAAVLCLFYPNKNGEASVVFIVKKSNSGVHSLQVGFPGGKYKKQDIDLSHTAIRETNEEVGVNQKTIKIIKSMTEIYIPPSNFIVQPYIAYTSLTPNFKPQISEIDSIFEVSLNSILNVSNQKSSIVKTSYGPNISVPSFIFKEHVIWGATAMILMEIVCLLNLIFKK